MLHHYTIKNISLSFPLVVISFFVLLFGAFSDVANAQCIDGDCLNGHGIFIYGDHSIYIGKFRDGKANGQGTCYYSTGTKYVGEWSDHQFHGIGTYYFEDGQADHGVWTFGELAQAQPLEDQFAGRTPLTWAVVVGAAGYQHLSPLDFPDDDAHRIVAFLKSPAGGAIKDEQIKILIDEGATKGNIIRHLHQTIEQVAPQDRLIFYFSGHGFEDALAPINIKGQQNKLYHKEIINLINSNPAQQRLCLIDACFVSGDDPIKSKNSQQKIQSDNYYEQFKTQPNTAFIFSASMKEASIEHRGLRQGVFSHFLLEGLGGAADSQGDKVVTIEEAANYVKERVRIYTNNYQNPTIINTFSNNTPLSSLD